MQNRHCFFILLLISPLFWRGVGGEVFGQTTFIHPLKGEKPLLTGNYGEVRPNHFHAGIDFKTHPSEHLPIYAVADGYVSRLKISSFGYGKVLYITHANGLVSVYGHEYAFADKIKTYAEAAQEIAQTFEIELFPKPTDLPVKQGEVIGYTGNTGSSQGPHLHFEFRDEKSEAPLNPLRYLKVEDVVAPRIQSIALYSEDKLERLLPNIKKTDTLKTSYAIGFGISCYDYEQVNGNKNNIYKAEMYVDGKLYYRHILDSIPFDLARYVNTYADYNAKKQRGVTIQKLFKTKNNELPIYKTINDKGFISFTDNAPHAIRIVVYDFYNQKDEVSFCVKNTNTNPQPFQKGRERATQVLPLGKDLGWVIQDCMLPYKVSTADYSIDLPAKSLYEDVPLTITYQNNILLFTTKEYSIPFQNNCTITLKVPQPLLKYSDKLCIADVTGGKSYVGGTFENGTVKASTKTFGKYIVDMDTVAPQIKLITQKKTAYKSGDIIYFKVSDAYSGIGVFKLFINGKWHLAEYEYKNNTIYFTVDDKLPKGKVMLNLQVSDKRNNQANLQTTLLIQ
ncbi:MAG: M23 family metallopeptidase [Bacteroidia bacterium]